MLVLMPAMAAWAVIPFSPGVVLADVNAGLLYVMAITSMGVYGVIIAGWASNSKYAFLGAMRSAAQIVAYEIAMGFALVCVLLVSQSLNLGDIVNGQGRGHFAGDGPQLPLLELAAAVPDVPRVLHLGGGGDQPRAVRRRRRRIRDRRRLPRRVLGHGVRAVLPRRVREHDPRVDAGDAHVPRRLAAAARLDGLQRDPRVRLAGGEGGVPAVLLPLVPRDVPALSLRPDHAPRLEGVHPAHDRLAGGDRRVDADAVEPVGSSEVRP